MLILSILLEAYSETTLLISLVISNTKFFKSRYICTIIHSFNDISILKPIKLINPADRIDKQSCKD